MIHRRRAECNSLTYYYFAVQYLSSRDITILYIILRIKQKTVHLVERGLTNYILLDQSNVPKRSASPRPTPTPTPPPSPPTRCPSHAPERRRVEQSYGSAGKGGGDGSLDKRTHPDSGKGATVHRPVRYLPPLSPPPFFVLAPVFVIVGVALILFISIPTFLSALLCSTSSARSTPGLSLILSISSSV